MTLPRLILFLYKGDEVVARDIALNKIHRGVADKLCQKTVALYHKEPQENEELGVDDNMKIFWYEIYLIHLLKLEKFCTKDISLRHWSILQDSSTVFWFGTRWFVDVFELPWWFLTVRSVRGSRLIFGMAIPVKQDVTLLTDYIDEDGKVVKRASFLFHCNNSLLPNQEINICIVRSSRSASSKRRGNFPPHIVKRLRQWIVDHIDHPFPTDQEVHPSPCHNGSLSNIHKFVLSLNLSESCLPISKFKNPIVATKPGEGVWHQLSASECVVYQYPTSRSSQRPVRRYNTYFSFLILLNLATVKLRLKRKIKPWSNGETEAFLC